MVFTETTIPLDGSGVETNHILSLCMTQRTEARCHLKRELTIENWTIYLGSLRSQYVHSPGSFLWLPLPHRREQLWKVGVPDAVSCGGLSEKIPHGLKCLDNCSAVGGAVWVSLGGMASLEKVCHWEHALKFHVCYSSSFSNFWLQLKMWASTTCFSCHAVTPSKWTLTLWNLISPNKLFLL